MKERTNRLGVSGDFVQCGMRLNTAYGSYCYNLERAAFVGNPTVIVRLGILLPPHIYITFHISPKVSRICHAFQLIAG